MQYNEGIETATDPGQPGKIMTNTTEKPVATEACPDLPKGQRCPKCGSRWICLMTNLPKEKEAATTPLEWQPLWDAMDAAPNDWIETTESMYFEMLECVPPRAMARGWFLVGEPKTHVDGEAVHACFRMTGTISDGTARFHAKHMTVAQFWTAA